MRGRRYKIARDNVSGYAIRAVWAPSLARRLMRHRLVRAAVVLGLGAACSLYLSNQVAALEAARSNWEETELVAVVSQPVEPGDLVQHSVVLTEMPVALVPANTVRAMPSQARAKVALYPGEVLLEERVTTTDSRGLAPGTVALTMPVVARVPLLEERDLVDLWLVDTANFSSQRIARNVVVLAFSDHDITVAVAQDQVQAATVASLRPVTVTLVG